MKGFVCHRGRLSKVLWTPITDIDDILENLRLTTKDILRGAVLGGNSEEKVVHGDGFGFRGRVVSMAI